MCVMALTDFFVALGIVRNLSCVFSLGLSKFQGQFQEEVVKHSIPVMYDIWYSGVCSRYIPVKMLEASCWYMQGEV